MIALGFGIGGDDSICIDIKHEQDIDSRSASRESLAPNPCRGGATGVMLPPGVVAWLLSQIKLQADRGLLPTFMFLWNRIGAVFLIPALAGRT